MKLTNCLLLAATLLAAINCPAATSAVNTINFPAVTGSEKQTSSPDALIRDLYKVHAKNAGTIVQGKNRSVLNKYFDKNLSGLIWKDITTHQDEIGVIDFDIFYNTQDPVISRLVVGAAKVSGDKATVAVTFNNDKAKNLVTYSLVKENSAWKISDIIYGKGESLLKYFKNAESN